MYTRRTGNSLATADIRPLSDPAAAPRTSRRRPCGYIPDSTEVQRIAAVRVRGVMALRYEGLVVQGSGARQVPPDSDDIEGLRSPRLHDKDDDVGSSIPSDHRAGAIERRRGRQPARCVQSLIERLRPCGGPPLAVREQQCRRTPDRAVIQPRIRHAVRIADRGAKNGPGQHDGGGQAKHHAIPPGAAGIARRRRAARGARSRRWREA